MKGANKLSTTSGYVVDQAPLRQLLCNDMYCDKVVARQKSTLPGRETVLHSLTDDQSKTQERLLEKQMNQLIGIYSTFEPMGADSAGATSRQHQWASACARRLIELRPSADRKALVAVAKQMSTELAYFDPVLAAEIEFEAGALTH